MQGTNSQSPLLAVARVEPEMTGMDDLEPGIDDVGVADAVDFVRPFSLVQCFIPFSDSPSPLKRLFHVAELPSGSFVHEQGLVDRLGAFA